MSNDVQVNKANGVLTLKIHRPERRNALTVDMYSALVDGLEQASEDNEVRVVLIRGSEGHFTAGNDLQDFMQQPPTDESSPVFQFLMKLVDFDKPLVAAVQGYAVGIGTTMLLHCDLVYASAEARLQMPFVNLGLAPEGASSLLLPKMMGHQRASELLLFGEPFSAEKARDYGLVNDVFPADAFEAEVEQRLETLVSRPLASLRVSKRLLKEDERQRLREVIRKEGAVFRERLTSPEMSEAVTAFFEKRKPDFSKFS